jgi:methylenetetrahydrofolate--tRNA-(uracil-5-)-methyltransferase
MRPENRSRTAYNLVGFQTRLKYGAQMKALRMIPALKNAEFLRMGSMHRNTYVCGPKALRPDLSLKGHPKVYLAGQITGVEGYLESAACGMLAAVFIFARIQNRPHTAPPANTALGALLSHVTASDPKNYQPNNIQFALFDPKFFEGTEGLKKDALRETLSKQAPVYFKNWMHSCGTLFLSS